MGIMWNAHNLIFFSPVDLWADPLQLDQMSRERPFAVCATRTAAEVN